MAIMDLSPTVLDLASGTYTVTRYSGAGGYGSDGIFAAPATSTFTIEASVQPVRGRELQRLPEGLRSEEVRAIFTPTALRCAAPGQLPDRISIGGESWQVEVVEDWSDLGNYYRAVARKVRE